MALISLRQLLDHAAENSYGVPAFNVNNMEQIQAIMRAAKTTDSPVILQASRGARSYAGDIFLRHLFDAAVEMCIRTFQFVFIRIMETILIHASPLWLTNLPV